MNERLQQFLSAENLTSAKLADILGVQRSGLSHILSGRNYPSYEFIRTILSKFPNLSADWLLLGKGKMYKDAGSPASPPVPSPSPASAASSEPVPLMNPVDEDPHSSTSRNLWLPKKMLRLTETASGLFRKSRSPKKKSSA